MTPVDSSNDCAVRSAGGCQAHPQQFKIPIQAAIASRVIAKCYGGDISSKKKLLQKQTKGMMRMKAMGKVEVSQKAFMAVLKLNQ